MIFNEAALITAVAPGADEFFYIEFDFQRSVFPRRGRPCMLYIRDFHGLRTARCPIGGLSSADIFRTCFSIFSTTGRIGRTHGQDRECFTFHFSYRCEFTRRIQRIEFNYFADSISIHNRPGRSRRVGDRRYAAQRHQRHDKNDKFYNSLLLRIGKVFFISAKCCIISLNKENK